MSGLEEDGFDVADAGRRVDQNQEEGGDPDDDDLADLADAEDQHHQRQDGDLGQDVDGRDDRVEGDPDRPVHSHDHAQDDPGDGAENETGKDPEEADPEMPFLEHLQRLRPSLRRGSWRAGARIFPAIRH